MNSFPVTALREFLSRREYLWGLLLLCFMQFSLLTSQTGMDFFAGAMLLTSLYWTAKYYKMPWSWPRLGLWWLWGSWLFVIGLGLALNPLSSSWQDLFFEFRWILDFYVFILFWSVFGENPKVLKFFAVALALCSLVAVVIYALGYNPLAEPFSQRAINLQNFANWRAGGIFNHSMPLAHTYGPLLMVFIGVLLAHWRTKQRLSPWIYAAFILTAATILLTFTRGVWIGVASGLLVMGYLINRKWGILLTAGLIGLGLIGFASSQKIRERITTTINLSVRGDSERLTLWKTNWEMFKDRPLLGAGYGQNRARLREYYDRMGVPAGYFEGHAHNQYMHFLAGTGILGLLCYLYFMFFTLRTAYLAYRKATSPLQMGIGLGGIGAMICFYIGGLTEANFSIGKNRFMILFIIAWTTSIYLQQLYLSSGRSASLRGDKHSS
ncbi:O-antigen ligase family protein [Bdellovibrio sp. HCB337]|uniref:O-antigen ligase family protein n=1 Tax=Bdellovibrio sp. HCB337 TaxID=3394358 RepID=UPI0039A71B1A